VDKLHLLPFCLGQHRLAIPVTEVVRVLPALLWTSLPGSPLSVDGIISLQGKLLVQVDLARCLGWPSPPLQLWRPLIWIKSDKRQLVIPVDQVDSVWSCPPEQLIPNTDPTINSTRLKGVIQTEAGILLIQDINQLLSESDELLLEQALQLALGQESTM
jgi:purine-binding chemotaxis protein CheW